MRIASRCAPGSGEQAPHEPGGQEPVVHALVRGQRPRGLRALRGLPERPQSDGLRPEERLQHQEPDVLQRHHRRQDVADALEAPRELPPPGQYDGTSLAGKDSIDPSSTFAGSGSGGGAAAATGRAPPALPAEQELAQHVRQDAAVAVVQHLLRRVDADDGGERLLRAVVAARARTSPRARREAAGDRLRQALDVEGLAARRGPATPRSRRARTAAAARPSPPGCERWMRS